jgi:hypothetical protein
VAGSHTCSPVPCCRKDTACCPPAGPLAALSWGSGPAYDQHSLQVLYSPSGLPLVPDFCSQGSTPPLRLVHLLCIALLYTPCSGSSPQGLIGVLQTQGGGQSLQEAWRGCL